MNPLDENFPFESKEQFEKVFVTFTDDFCVSDGEKELVIAINVEFAFDVALDNKLDEDNYLLVGNSNWSLDMGV